MPALCRLTSLTLSINSAYSYGADSTALTTAKKTNQVANDSSLTVIGHAYLEATNKVVVSAQQMQKIGANDFGTLMRYQPLASATGSGGGSITGKSGFDRGGYTGYNIRGLESNRVGIDVDGMAMPTATGRGYAGRVGVNTFGIGRDYVDPYLFSAMDIEGGATGVAQPNTSIGGLVAFHSKSADDYLSSKKNHWSAV